MVRGGAQDEAAGIDNLAALLVDRADRHPDHTFGVGESATTLGQAVELGGRLATSLLDLGIGPASRVAVVGRNSPSYLLTWTALQLVGAEPALINPGYPASLIEQILRPLDPLTVIWVGCEPERSVAPRARHFDLSAADRGVVVADGDPGRVATRAANLPGLDRHPLDVAGYMHTSGTTGAPKLCVQTHEYFLRLGRFIADSLMLTAHDRVLTPLPLFHINPLGYGVIGGLVGHSSVLACSRFSASAFWKLLRDEAITVAVLHAPPIEILKRSTSPADSRGHGLRAVLFADEAFLTTFGVPAGLSVYGSTEVGGLSHTWTWRSGEAAKIAEGMSRYGGRARPDVRWDLADDGEILVAADRAGVLFSGYVTADGTDASLDRDGWFHTGDVGRIDALGNLVFVERAAEAIRVKGEYVPIAYVEDHFRSVEGVEDLAIWRRDSHLVDHEIVLYVVASPSPFEAIARAAEELPASMRPSVVVTVAGPLPRDTGVGKVRRRELDTLETLDRRSLG